MPHICLRCTKSTLGQCKKGYNKTEMQLRNENFGCFDERIYYINESSNDCNELYSDKIVNKKDMTLHMNMVRSERLLKKT